MEGAFARAPNRNPTFERHDGAAATQRGRGRGDASMPTTWHAAVTQHLAEALVKTGVRACGERLSLRIR